MTNAPSSPWRQGRTGQDGVPRSGGERRSYGGCEVGVDEGGRSRDDHQDGAGEDRRLLDDAAPSVGAIGEQLAPLLATEPGCTDLLGAYVDERAARRHLVGRALGH